MTPEDQMRVVILHSEYLHDLMQAMTDCLVTGTGICRIDDSIIQGHNPSIAIVDEAVFVSMSELSLEATKTIMVEGIGSISSFRMIEVPFIEFIEPCAGGDYIDYQEHHHPAPKRIAAPKATYKQPFRSRMRSVNRNR